MGESMTVARLGQQIFVEPQPFWLRAALSAASNVAVQDRAHDLRLVKRLRYLLDAAAGPNAGLAPVLGYLGRAAGLDVVGVREVGSGPRSLPAPEAMTISDTCPPPPHDPGLLEFIRGCEHGVVMYGKGRVEPARLVAQIGLAFPTATVAVAAATNGEVEKVSGQIRRWLPGVATATADRCPADVGPVVVATYYGLAHAQVEVEKRDIVIALDARQAIGDRGMLALSAARRARLFGLLPLGATLAPWDRDRITCVFGLEELAIPRHGYKERAVGVACLPITGGPGLPGNMSLVDLKRRGIWGHPVRNRRIARLAEAMKTGNRDWMVNHASAVATYSNRLGLHGVRVVVETVEHALALAAVMPGWPILTGRHVAEQGLSGGQRRLLAERRAGSVWADHGIVTAGGLEELDLSAVDGVIWAGAGLGPAPLPERGLECRQGEEQPLLLVDFADRHHPVLRRWARSRQRAYIEQGWFPAGMDALVARVKRFLSERPGGRS